jgi:hypothetical protein
MSRGIYLVANKRSQDHCENLIHSIRRSGCQLPIRLIPYGGEPVDSSAILAQVEVTPEASYPAEARALVDRLCGALSCPRGFVLRYLAFYSDWDHFLYSDNDIVALMDWSELFSYFDTDDQPDVVHADEEYTTKGIYNFRDPSAVTKAFGEVALEQAITAGHFLCRRDPRLVQDVLKGLAWMQANPSVVIPHDQTLLHVAALLGNWRIRNLCKAPDHWASSWAGDYQDPLTLIHLLNGRQQRRVSHVHYSGDWPDGSKPIEVLLDSFRERDAWNRHAAMQAARHTLGINRVRKVIKKVRRRLGC